MKMRYSVLTLIALLTIVFMAPFGVIWALNTLFTLNIAYTFWTYLAVCVLNITWFRKVDLSKATNVKITGG